MWHQRTGAGALFGPVGVTRGDTPEDGVDPSSARGARVVSGGVAYPLGDQRALDALGWTRGQALPAAWLALAANGSALRASS